MADTSNSNSQSQRQGGSRSHKESRIFTHLNGAPKRPPSSFGIYKHRLRKTLKGRVNFKKFNAAASKKWNSLSVQAKAPFIERARKLMAEYNKAKQSYMRRKLRNLRKRFGPDVVSPSPKSRRKPRVDRRKIAARTNPYLLFAQRERLRVKRQMPNASFAEISREIGRRWKEASVAVKQAYARRAKNQMMSRSPSDASLSSASSSSDSMAVSPVSNVASPPTRRGSTASSSPISSVTSRLSRGTSSAASAESAASV